MTSSQKDRPERRVSLALLAVIAGLSPFAMSIVVPALPAVGQALDSELSQTQFLVSAYLIGLGLFQPIQGPLCDRFGRRKVLLVSLTGFFLTSLLAALAKQIELLIVLRFLQAGGSSACTVSARAVIRDLFSGTAAASALATMAGAMGIAPLIAPSLGGWLTETWGWQVLFGATAVVSLALIGWVSARLPETLAPELRRPIRVAVIASGVRRLLSSRTFLGYTFLFACGNAAFFAFVAIGPDLFAARFGTTPTRFGVYWSSFAGSYLCASFLTAHWSKTVGPKRLLRRAVGTAATVAVIFPFLATYPSASPGYILVPMTVISFCLGVMYPLSLAGAVDPFPEQAGTAAGWTSALGMLLSAAFATAVGALYDGSGRALGYGVLLGIAGCGIGWLMTRNTEH